MHITETTVGGCLLLTLRGDLNAQAAAVVRRALRKALLDSPAPVVCDLAGVGHFTPSSLTVFPTAYASSGGWPRVVLALTGAAPVLRQALHDNGVARRVPLMAREDVLAGPPHRTWRPEVVTRTTGLSPTPRACGEARHEVTEFCAAVGCDEQTLDDVRLVVSELAANAVTHGRPPVELRLLATTSAVLVAVHDGSPRVPVQQAPVQDHGRGLTIVAALSSGWSSTQIPGDGKLVTARISRHRTARS